MSEHPDPDVLIIGAGPTGLLLAIVLSRLGVRVQIVDRKAGPTRESRAVVLQARTLEVEPARDVADSGSVTVRSPEGSRVIRARFYVGADGSNSRVQRSSCPSRSAATIREGTTASSACCLREALRSTKRRRAQPSTRSSG